MSSVEVPTRKRLPLTRAQVKLLVDGGLVTPGTSEFLNGELIEKMPQNQPHSAANDNGYDTLTGIFGRGFVQHSAPVFVDANNSPEPDLAVLRRHRREFAENPAAEDCVLVVEVSDATLSWDRTEKLKLYARAEIAEYWIVDINNRRLIVHRRPTNDEYLDIHTFTDTESVAPLARPEETVAVSELLP
jgi:Uma2 family endonuclease